MKSTKAMRDRARELATPARDDYDRAVLAVLDDFDTIEQNLETAAVKLAEERHGRPKPVQARRGSTYTFAELEVPAELYDVVARKLIDANYVHCFEPGAVRRAYVDPATTPEIDTSKLGPIDMHGIALTRGPATPPQLAMPLPPQYDPQYSLSPDVAKPAPSMFAAEVLGIDWGVLDAKAPAVPAPTEQLAPGEDFSAKLGPFVAFEETMRRRIARVFSGRDTRRVEEWPEGQADNR